MEHTVTVTMSTPIPEASTDENGDGLLYANCTSLYRLDLADVFNKMDIGNAEFWGSMSGAWLTCFLIYYVTFFILSIFLACTSGYFLYHAIKQSFWFRFLRYTSSFVIAWFCFGCIHHFLLMISVVNGSGVHLSNSARVFEMFASSTFVNFVILTVFFDPNWKAESRSHSHLPERGICVVLCVVPIYSIAGILIIISLSAGSSALAALFFFQILMLIASTLLVNLDIQCKRCFKSRKQLRLLWTTRKLLSYPYFLISCVYAIYMLSTVASNSKCIENVHLQRAVWIVLNSLLKFSEVVFLIIYFVQVKRVVEPLSLKLTTLASPRKDYNPMHSKSFSFVYQSPEALDDIHLREVDLATLKATTNHEPDLVDTERIEPQKVQICATKSFHPVEIEELCRSPNWNVKHSNKVVDDYNGAQKDSINSLSYSRSLSTITNSFFNVFQSESDMLYSDECLSSQRISSSADSSSILEVVMVPAQSPVDSEHLIGEVEIGLFDERGGVFHSYKHGVTVILPAGAIPNGILAELKFAAMLVAPVKFTGNKRPVSALYWLCMNVTLHKPIQVRMPLMHVNNKSIVLQFAKSLHSSANVIDSQMDICKGGKFAAGEAYGSLEVDHFCYYCIVDTKLDPSDIPTNKYLVVAMKQPQPSIQDNIWRVDICLIPLLKTCLEHLKSQYDDCEWSYEVLSEFSFVGCNDLKIQLSGTFEDPDAATVEMLQDAKISQKDVDFRQYYSNNGLEELKFKMDMKLYPPRRKARVQARHKDFFEISKNMNFVLICGPKSISVKVTIPSTTALGSIASEANSSANSSLQRDQNGSVGTSGYRSDESLDNENDLAFGKLQLGNLLLLTKKIDHKWFELGVALHIPISKLERLADKYGDIPVKALVRLYRYWLADKNGLQPTKEKLLDALQNINEFGVYATSKDNFMGDGSRSAVSSDQQTEILKDHVIKSIQPSLLDFPTLVPVLNKHNLVTQHDNYILLNKLTSPTERANALIYVILPSKGPGAFKVFIECLKEEKEHSGHQELAKRLVLPVKSKMMETTV